MNIIDGRNDTRSEMYYICFWVFFCLHTIFIFFAKKVLNFRYEVSRMKICMRFWRWTVSSKFTQSSRKHCGKNSYSKSVDAKKCHLALHLMVRIVNIIFLLSFEYQHYITSKRQMCKLLQAVLYLNLREKESYHDHYHVLVLGFLYCLKAPWFDIFTGWGLNMEGTSVHIVLLLPIHLTE